MSWGWGLFTAWMALNFVVVPVLGWNWKRARNNSLQSERTHILPSRTARYRSNSSDALLPAGKANDFPPLTVLVVNSKSGEPVTNIVAIKRYDDGNIMLSTEAAGRKITRISPNEEKAYKFFDAILESKPAA
jgi:hypothetical protein